MTSFRYFVLSATVRLAPLLEKILNEALVGQSVFYPQCLHGRGAGRC